MQEKVSFWVSMGMLVCIGIAALIIALHASGMPISGWGLICSVEDADVVSCFRDWITSGAAVLTGVAIVFAVAQVREANRQGDAATRASLVHFKGELVAEREAVMGAHGAARDLTNAINSAFAVKYKDEPALRALAVRLQEADDMMHLARFQVSGVTVGALPDVREQFAEVRADYHWKLSIVLRTLRFGIKDDALDYYLQNVREVAILTPKVMEHLRGYQDELMVAIGRATDKIAALDAEVFAERH